MIRVLVIADDLTGAAEIAAIGRRYGLPSRLSRQPLAGCAAGLTVLDTNSRLLAPANAAGVVRQFVSGLRGDGVDLIYKKTDSVLRGSVRAELDALREHFARPIALLVPQNPSRGRTIEDGEYRIHGTPLHETPFRDDPDHPATTSRVARMPTLGIGVSCIAPGAALPASGIAVGDAATTGDVGQWAAHARPDVLPAGGADYFAAILEDRGYASTVTDTEELPQGRRLFVCGSASGGCHAANDRADEQDVPVCPMPDPVFHASDSAALSRWAALTCAALRDASRAMMVIRQPVERRPGLSRRLEIAMAEATARVLQHTPVASLLIEGGATASAVSLRMGWHAFNVHGELAPGVAWLRLIDAPAPAVCVKPGSYPWPPCVWTRS